MINKINRNDLESLVNNRGQNEIGPAIINFASKIPEILDIENLKYVDELFYTYLNYDKHTKKFACISEEIFARKTYSGCSDIGLSLSVILRIKGIPTIYVESAKIEWIKFVQDNDPKKEFMQGHIFLEIFLNNKWYLYDPTFHLIYDGYDYNNLSLPREYYVFAKALNCHEIGVHSVDDEKKISMEVLKDFIISDYKNPNYKVIDLRDLSREKNLPR